MNSCLFTNWLSGVIFRIAMRHTEDYGVTSSRWRSQVIAEEALEISAREVLLIENKTEV